MSGVYLQASEQLGTIVCVAAFWDDSSVTLEIRVMMGMTQNLTFVQLRGGLRDSSLCSVDVKDIA